MSLDDRVAQAKYDKLAARNRAWGLEPPRQPGEDSRVYGAAVIVTGILIAFGVPFLLVILVALLGGGPR